MASGLDVEAAATAASENRKDGEDRDKEKTWQKRDGEYLLIVVTFMATVAYQAGVNPPGGAWQEDKNSTIVAGKSIMATQEPERFTTYIVGMTVCMIVSLLQFTVLLSELPGKTPSVSRSTLYYTLSFALVGLLFSYGSSVIALTPKPLIRDIVLSLALSLASGLVVMLILLYIQKT